MRRKHVRVLKEDLILTQIYLGVRVPVSPPTPPPPNTLNPPSAYVVKRKLWTIKLAKAETPAMAHTPGNEKPATTFKYFNLQKQEGGEGDVNAPARRNRIPAVSVIVALMLSSMFPIFKHFSANMATRKPMAPKTTPTIIKARTACSRAESQSQRLQQFFPSSPHTVTDYTWMSQNKIL